MKTRIKVVRDSKGADTYYPQYKGLFFWNHFITYDYAWDECKAIVGFVTEEKAKRFIDNKLTPVRYIKYP